MDEAEVFEQEEISEVELADEISIIDYARKNGIDIISENETTAYVVDPETKQNLTIFKESNSWRLEDRENEENSIVGRTIRFAARMENVNWKSAMEKLVRNRKNYLSAEEYNSDFTQRMQLRNKERQEQKRVLEVAAKEQKGISGSRDRK